MATTPALADRTVAKLWLRMAEVYGHRWTSAYGDDATAGAGPTWGKGLAGLTPGQIARGIEACIVAADPWPPTLPAFRAMCLGIPSLAEVRQQLTGPFVQRSAFAVLVWQHIDSWAFARAEQKAAERMLAEAYATAREHAMRGGEMPDPQAKAITAAPARKPFPCSPEQAQKHIDDIQRVLRLSDDEVPDVVIAIEEQAASQAAAAAPQEE